ncbi:CDP-diacylglycerol--glycerol-3-phosphate 3-phosphatidyltransferase [Thermodesulfobacterium hveragerdense]|uniref:CDP-diacylglycerol--glycerol-3-phosphate 3-phosphatidyltransferase n=1 Tax=Thermodesulfobacterium hveragerdense TaxID=53424 RepID=UPI0006881BC5|nr:CDP-diacylglycerol--glycerol-3-phosphate 3-phosphatidyltransferase [Thermodesulfobacterium hveragerdense]
MTKRINPNLLTLLRVVCLPVPCVLLFINSSITKFIAMGLLLFLSLTDYFDGLLARKYNRTSKLGALLDPIADKIFVTTIYLILVKLAYFPFLPVFFLLLREILISFLRSILPQSMKVNLIAKFKTFFQMSLAVGVIFAKTLYPNLNPTLVEILVWIAVLLSYLSALKYILQIMNKLNYIFQKKFQNKLLYEVLCPLLLLLFFPFTESFFWGVPFLTGMLFLKGANKLETDKKEERITLLGFFLLSLAGMLEAILWGKIRFSLLFLLFYLILKEGIKSFNIIKEAFKG